MQCGDSFIQQLNYLKATDQITTYYHLIVWNSPIPMSEVLAAASAVLESLHKMGWIYKENSRKTTIEGPTTQKYFKRLLDASCHI